MSTNNYWIKLYHEILNDPKIGMLPDNVWRRCIEVFLMAGEVNSKGNLPATSEIAWRLRQNPETLEAELEHLAKVGILEHTKTGWFVVKFAKRQAKISDADKQRAYRDRQRQAVLETPPEQLETPPEPECYPKITEALPEDNPSVTEALPEVTQITDTDTDTEKEYPTKVGGKPSPKSNGKVKRKSKKHQPAGTKQASQAMFSALVDITITDLSMITKDERGALNQAEKKMRENGLSPGDIQAFSAWWYKNDWRGQKGQPPKLEQVRNEWGKFKRGINNNGGKNATHQHSTSERNKQTDERKRAHEAAVKVALAKRQHPPAV